MVSLCLTFRQQVLLVPSGAFYWLPMRTIPPLSDAWSTAFALCDSMFNQYVMSSVRLLGTRVVPRMGLAPQNTYVKCFAAELGQQPTSPPQGTHRSQILRHAKWPTITQLLFGALRHRIIAISDIELPFGQTISEHHLGFLDNVSDHTLSTEVTNDTTSSMPELSSNKEWTKDTGNDFVS